MYYNGMGVTKDLEEAAKWMDRAAQQGNVSAMTGLGICYYYGHGVKRDKNKGREWINKAAILGDEYAKEVQQSLR